MIYYSQFVNDDNLSVNDIHALSNVLIISIAPELLYGVSQEHIHLELLMEVLFA